MIRRHLLVLLGAALLLAGPGVAQRRRFPPPPSPVPRRQTDPNKPNIILIMTDDQDTMMNSTHPYYLPMLHKHMRLQGTEVPHFVTSVGNCCPSRTVLLTGRHCHNTNLTANDAPHGGYIGFKNKKLDASYLPFWLKDAGYRTYWLGKALNGFSSYFADKYGCLPGWDHLMPSVAPPSTEAWIEYKASLAKVPPVYLKYYYTNCKYFEKKYGLPDDNLFTRAHELIEDSVDSKTPFFLKLAVSAPHDGPVGNMPRISNEFLNAFVGLKVPRGPNYGKPIDPRFDMSKQKPLWWDTTDSDTRYRARAQSLLATDQQLDELVRKLECLGILNNTYIIFTSDNGYKLGQHNIPQEKWTYYEEDVALPFFIRGPGVPRGVYAGTVQAAMVDVTATILHIANATVPHGYQLDGAPIPLDLIGALNPTPNSPFYNYTGPAWNAPPGTNWLTAPSPASAIPCARSPRPPPAPPFPPFPPPCKGVCGKKGANVPPSDDDDTEDGLINLLALHGSAFDEGGSAAAAAGHRHRLMEAEDAAAGMAALAAGQGGDGGSEAHRLRAAESRMLQAASAVAPWSNLALIEQWKFGKLWRGSDYRVVRACMPPSAAVARSAAGSSRAGNACYKYVVYCNARAQDGPQRLNQLFNLTVDQGEINDLLLRAPLPSATKRLVDRLDAALTVLAYCKGATCAQPFSRIHPGGGVINLADAMDPQYDALYAGFKKLDYVRCVEYYDPANELPDLRLVPPDWMVPSPPLPPTPPSPKRFGR